MLETVERARMAGATNVAARLGVLDDELVMSVGLDRVTDIDVTDVADRVDAAGGTLTIDRVDGGTALMARFPMSAATAGAPSPSNLISEPS